MFLNIIHFPPQKKLVTEKTEDWYKKCMDSALSLVFSDIGESIRQKKYQMHTNYKLANDQLDTKDVEQVVNYWGMDISTFPAKMQNYPIAYNKVLLLIGEELKRPFRWNVSVINPDAISDKEQMINAKIKEFITEKITAKELDEQTLQQEIAKLDKWRKYEAQDLRELRARQILNYHYNTQYFQLMFNRGYEDALIGSEEIYCADIVAGEPIARKVNPLNLYTLRLGDNFHIDESDIIMEDGFVPVGEVLDRFGEFLTSQEITDIEEGKVGSTSASGSIISNINWNEPIMSPSMYSLNGEGLSIASAGEASRYLNGSFDFEGNIRVSRAVWRGMKKIGKLTYMDEDGTPQETFVDESYRINKDAGETIAWRWINEWYETTKIGSDIYVKMQPRPVQFRSMVNPSKCASGYVGTVYNINTNKGISLMDRMKPWQYLFNTIMYRTELAIARHIGPVMEMDLAKKPDNLSTEQWLYYGQLMGIMFVDSFKEATKGAHTGQLAGGFNTTGKVLNPDMGNYIQQNMALLAYCEQQVGKVSGVSPQREGQIDNRETVGGVERATTQSSHITEKYFSLHENTKTRFMNVFLDTAKYAYRNVANKKFAYIGNDQTQILFTLEGDELNEAEYGIFVANSQNDQELIAAMKGLAQAGIQNDKLSYANLMDIYMSQDVQAIRRKIETFEDDKTQAMQQQVQAEQQNQQVQTQIMQQEAQGRIQNEVEKIRIEEESNIRDNNTKLEVAYINAESKQMDNDIDNDGIADDMELAKMELKREEMIQKQTLAREQMNQKIQIEREKIAAQKSIAANKPTNIRK